MGNVNKRTLAVAMGKVKKRTLAVSTQWDTEKKAKSNSELLQSPFRGTPRN